MTYCLVCLKGHTLFPDIFTAVVVFPVQLLQLSLPFRLSCCSCPCLSCSAAAAVLVFVVQLLPLFLPFLFSCHSCPCLSCSAATAVLAFPVQLLQLPCFSCSAAAAVLAFPVQLLQLSLPFLFSCDSCLLIKLVSLFLIAC